MDVFELWQSIGYSFVNFDLAVKEGVEVRVQDFDIFFRFFASVPDLDLKFFSK
jgi:hypothetical protein